ncbi:MAG: CCC motif membrane protein [Bacteroidota bacterium]
MSDVLDNLGSSNNFTGNKTLPNATASLVLGIISIATCWIYGLPGIVCGIIAIVLHNKDKKIYMDDPQSYQMSYKNLKAGYICGIIGLSLSAFFILYIIVVFALVGTAFMSMSKY